MLDRGGIGHQRSLLDERVDIRRAGGLDDLRIIVVLLHYDHHMGRLRNRGEHLPEFELFDGEPAAAVAGQRPLWGRVAVVTSVGHSDETNSSRWVGARPCSAAIDLLSAR